MSQPRSAEFSLLQAIQSPSFTPRQRDAAALWQLLLDGADLGLVVLALTRLGPTGAAAGLSRLQAEQGAARALLVRALGRLAVAVSSAEIRQALHQLLDDPDAKVSRYAAIALGKLPHSPQTEELLLMQLQRAANPQAQRVLAEALGKVGSEAALRTMAQLHQSSEASSSVPLLTQTVQRAELRLQRSLLRAQSLPGEQAIDVEAQFPGPTQVTLRCRSGLTSILVDELLAARLLRHRHEAHVEDAGQLGQPGRVTLTVTGPLSQLFAARTFVDWILPLPLDPVSSLAALPQQVALALSSERTQALLQALSVSPLRYRIELSGAGHRRALVWQLAQEIGHRCPYLLNDPKDSPWELLIDDSALKVGGAVRLALRPRQLPDPRFGYRVGDVPAASHPTLAAALAKVAAVAPGEVVWDPFVGSGSELIETARLQPQARLYGSDLDAAALQTAAENAQAAGAKLALRAGDAQTYWPAGTRVVLTNPPMGGRVSRGQVTDLLTRFAHHVGQRLPEGGRLVWLNPQPRRHGPLLQQAGLSLRVAHSVDMNGFWAQLEVWQR